MIVVLIVLTALAGMTKKAAAPVPAAPTSSTDMEVVQPAQKDDLIVVDTPLPGSVISSPLVVKGRARGNWFFEASFPVVLTDWDGRIIAQGYAQAQGDWMTTQYVPFIATLSFVKPDTSVRTEGILILKKDNPSGEPKFDDALEIWIQYE